MTVLVTGAAGHVGGALVRALLAAGQPARALIHSDRRAIAGLDVEIAAGDTRDPSSLSRACAGVEVVYHAAGHISLRMNEWPLLHAVNVIGTRNVVQACLHAGVRRLIHFSSIHAFQQQPDGLPLDESRPRVAPAGRGLPYDRSKAAGEAEVRAGMARGLDAVILNPTAILGPYDFRPSFFGEALLALARRRMPTLIPAGFDWVDVRDVVAGALRAAERAPAGAQYLLSGHWVDFRDLAALAAQITGVPAPRLTCPMPLAHLAAPFATAYADLLSQRPLCTYASLKTLQDGSHVVSHARATRELGYQPRPFSETLTDTYRWFVETGKLTL